MSTMKRLRALSVVFLLCLAGCVSVDQKPGPGDGSLQASVVELDDQITNINYVIYKTYERYQAAKADGKNSKEIRDIEIELSKLQEIKEYLEASQSKALR